MAKKEKKEETMTESTQTPENKAPQAPAIGVIGQYIRDLSVESPLGMVALMQLPKAPQYNVGIDVRAQKLSDGVYEVVLMMKGEVPAPDDAKKRIFLVELAYAGIFRVQNVEEAQLQPMLFVYCPSLLFPFARRIMADASRDGGAPMLNLDPIDFGALYNQRAKQAQEKAAS